VAAGAISDCLVLAELGHSQIQNRPLISMDLASWLGRQLNALPDRIIVNAGPSMNLAPAISAVETPCAIFREALLNSLIAQAALGTGKYNRGLGTAGHRNNMRPESGIC
jgi:hypothetical protein